MANKDALTTKKILNSVFTTKNTASIDVLRLLHALCNYAGDSAVLSKSGEFDINAMLYDEGRRSIYTELRRYIHPKTLALVENPEKEENND